MFPLAPATFASLVALAVYYTIPLTGDSLGLYLLIGIGFPLGVWATGTLTGPTNPDPKKAVWDEYVGMWTTCLLLPKTLDSQWWLIPAGAPSPWLAAAFVCFRALDIWKPWPIRRLERLPGGLGIMADDLLAGIAGAAALNAVRLALAAP